jgi:hypothetical protein
MAWWNPLTWSDSGFYDPTEELSDDALSVETDDQRMPWHDED